MKWLKGKFRQTEGKAPRQAGKTGKTVQGLCAIKFALQKKFRDIVVSFALC
jgi:hypothetical protein